MPLPRYRLLLAVLAPLALALLAPLDIQRNIAWWEALLDLAHVPVFALVTWLLYATNPAGLLPRRAALTFAVITALVAAAGIELLQSCTGRSASLNDLANGAFGIAAAALVLTHRPVFAALILFAALLNTLPPLVAQTRARLWRAQHFPMLGDFESDAELPLWLTDEHDLLLSGAPRERVPLHATRGRFALRVPGRQVNWPGVRLLCADQDWSRYSTLAFDLYSEDGGFTLAVRIDDAGSSGHHDRFNTALTVQPGANSFRLPFTEITRTPTRALDLRKIRRLVFFELHAAQPHTFYLDNVRLE